MLRIIIKLDYINCLKRIVLPVELQNLEKYIIGIITSIAYWVDGQERLDGNGHQAHWDDPVEEYRIRRPE